MSTGRKINRYALALQHRREQYYKAVQLLIDGKATPEYVTERWEKLKNIQGKGR